MNHRSLFFYEAKDSAYNTIDFIDYLKQFIDRLNNEEISGAVIVMDNVRFHHATDVIDLIESHGHRITFLPAYSPFLNPIEELFNQLKFYCKSFNPKTPDEVFRAVELASDVISEENCRNYYKHMLTYLPKCIEMEEIDY